MRHKHDIKINKSHNILKDYYIEKCGQCRNWDHNQFDHWISGSPGSFFDSVSNFPTVKKKNILLVSSNVMDNFVESKRVFFFLCFLSGFSHPDWHVQLNCHIWETLRLLSQLPFLHEAHFTVDQPVIYPAAQHLNAASFPSPPRRHPL